MITTAAIMLAILPTMPTSSSESESESAAAFSFTHIPPRGSSDLFIRGRVTLPNGQTNFADYRLVTHIRVAGNWWGPKPAPGSSRIFANGQFEVQYASHGEAGDLTADEIAIFLIPHQDGVMFEITYNALQNFPEQTRITRTASAVRVDGEPWQPPEPSDPEQRFADFDERFPGVRKDVVNAARYSVNYSPFVAPYDARGGAIPPESLIREHLTLISRGFDSVRFFTAQDSLLIMYDIARELGLNVIGTAWIDRGMSESSIRRQLDNLIELANSGKITIASVGSEVLFRGDMMPSRLLGYVNYVREGITAPVPVTYMDSAWWFTGVDDHEVAGLAELNRAVDLILYSHYPVFSGNYNNPAMIEANGGVIPYALAEFRNVYRDIRRAQGDDKPIIVAETGWVTSGDSWIGSAQPSMQHAREYWTALQAWARSEDADIFWFNAFDEAWKPLEGVLDARHWGIYYEDGTLKEAYIGLIPPFVTRRIVREVCDCGDEKVFMITRLTRGDTVVQRRVAAKRDSLGELITMCEYSLT
jgi:exo-beta-1,3-glucanase (GH17 family)